MASYSFRLLGSFTAEPISGVPSGIPFVDGGLDEALTLQKRAIAQLELNDDNPHVVQFGDMGAAHVVIVQADAKVRARVTSADGSLQYLPIDPLGILISNSVPFTAIDLLRASGAGTVNATVFLGQRA